MILSVEFRAWTMLTHFGANVLSASQGRVYFETIATQLIERDVPGDWAVRPVLRNLAPAVTPGSPPPRGEPRRSLNLAIVFTVGGPLGI
ncbi:MAG: hypothetical protein JWM11_3216, partial [Planctomycetaceae bacterium]|nr:hypothetical protein [Planctomycetaceae bacterium]